MNGAAWATAAWVGGSVPAWRRFRQALRDPVRAQEQVLARIVAAGRGSGFGRDHHLGSVRSLADFAAAVPARTWEELTPWLEAARAGVADELTTVPITRFEPTSGTSTARKLIPSTSAGRRELREAVGAWIVDTVRQDPQLLGGPSYWSMSPSLPPELTRGGVPVGFDDDAGYLGGLTEPLVRRALVAPRRGLQGEPFWRATAEALLRARELRLVSIWNPSFGVLLTDAVRRHWDTILPSLPRSRANELARVGPEGAWPRLRLVSAWADAAAAAGVDPLTARFPGARFQAKGLLATEGIVSLPFAGTHPIALTSHFLELARPDGAIVPLCTAAEGDEGTVVLTTGSGLWRYHLRDRVAVTGRLVNTPTVRFLGREDAVSDRQGEKLGERFVAAVLDRLGVRGFAMLAAEDGGYVLFAEHPPPAVALEDALCENPHYRWCVSIGQLRPASVVRVGAEASVRYVAAKARDGRRHGDVKPTVLEPTAGWGPILGP